MNQLTKHAKDSISEHQVHRFQELILTLYQCCQDRMQSQSDRFGLPDAELRCLRLFGKERYLTSKGIAPQMGVVKSRVTKIIEGLVNKGLIQRLKDPEDSRITLLSLTTAGQEKLAQINQYVSATNLDVLAKMTPEQRNSLLAHLEILKVSMDAARTG
jgi:DNA-binding MarR family transcriptional regulator